ncbi:hypothetical protein N7532_012086 [Penicillium argentinense]|uniref:Uncharacterized protein n=1 Tax=Penicillium argentinense TaxID=1131581 RepID=A0A9W9EJL9_9EURO|nr:uncharacterized protein N7532_012086 [Penicillium argentinense]KAJ5083043.1 hypothetical protein N7532_012086 [Penicillium argentinense]
MKLHWPAICIAGAIASAIPSAASHELHLPYLPTLDPEDPVDTYLSIKWAIQNGSLYANEDQVFPPAMSMQLHAPLYEGHRKTRIEQEDIQLSYAIDARPLSSEENGSRSDILRVHVELLDKTGRPVTPNAVVLDLLDHPDGTYRITRIRRGTCRGHRGDRHPQPRPWQMKFWKTQVNALLSHEEKPASFSSPKPLNAKPAQPQKAATAVSDTESTSHVGYIFSPYWFPSTYPTRPPPSAQPRPKRLFLRLVRPVILPALLGAGAGLVACVVGFCVGHLVISLSVRLGLCKRRERRRHHSRPACIEEGTLSEKSQLMVPQIHISPSTDI